MRILLSAFACDPQFGSDEEVGWRWALNLAAAGHQVCVLTRTSHRAAIEAHAPDGIRFEYVDAPRVQKGLERINHRNHLYYPIWQWLAYRRARALQREQAFERVHHVSWVSFRQPSFMGRLGIPFVFGPVAGGDEVPAALLRRLAFADRLRERLRAAVNALVRWDPLMRATYRQADAVWVTSPAHLARLPAVARAKTRVALAIAGEGGASAAIVQPPAPAHRLLFVGRALGIKGMDLGLRAFARALRERPELRLTLLTEGPQRERWQRLGAQLGIEAALHWLPWRPKEQVAALMGEHDLLLCPALRDSGGFVVLEALQLGRPVVCLKLGGPGVLVDASVGEAVEAQADADATERALAQACLRQLERLDREPGLAAACRARAAAFNWPALVRRIHGGAA